MRLMSASFGTRPRPHLALPFSAPRAGVCPLCAIQGLEALAPELRLELRGPRDDREDEFALHRGPEGHHSAYLSQPGAG